MKIADSYSVIVVPKDRAKIKRWVLSRERILGTLLLLVGLVFLTGLLSIGLIHYRQEFMATEDLRLRGKHYEKERVQLLNRLSQLESVVNRNAKLATQLETVIGLNPESGVQVGIGGKSDEHPFKLQLQLAALHPSSLQKGVEVFDEATLKSYNLRTIDLTEEAREVGERFQEVYHFHPDAGYFWSSMPTVIPVEGWVTSDFGLRRSPLTGGRQLHQGIDIASPFGNPVVASGDGVVTFAGHNGGLGNKIVIDHGYGIASVYGHNSKLLVEIGVKVNRGDVIAEVGSTGRSTGPHLHYEILVDGLPVDPRRFILGQL